MNTVHSILLILMACFYLFAGFSHFKNPIFFLKITPKWVPFPKIVNWIVGIVEIVLGIGVLVPYTRSISAIGIIILLILVFPANVYHFQKAWRKKKKKAVWITLTRLPIQILLIWWAYSYI